MTRTTGGTLLSYTLTTVPDPIRIGAPATLRLIARGGDTPAHCRRITVSVPTGAGAGALTNDPTTITTPPVQGGDHPDQGGGWTIVRSPRAGLTDFTATPAAGPGWIAGVTPLTLELDAVAVNPALGAAVLTVTEETSADGTDWHDRTTGIPVPKFPADFVFRSFAPDSVNVANGEPVRLTWDGSPAVYTMRWGPRGECDVSHVTEWTSPPLHDTTTFRLSATMPGSTAERVLTTLVTVFRPHLDVGDLDLRRNVRMIGPDQRLTPPAPGHRLTLCAPTDGILIGHVRTKLGAAPATVRVTTTTGTTVEYSQLFTSDNRDPSRVPTETPFHVPVRRGATVDITATGTTDDDFGLTWLPHGTGRLEPLG